MGKLIYLGRKGMRCGVGNVEILRSWGEKGDKFLSGGGDFGNKPRSGRIGFFPLRQGRE